jgi:ubiquinone/menaquinone biosynthesis C-methylase UbiE|tara:strand:+ start:2518 stop:3342 length:825 start_codon:yes stop_codon:yes gene_type:complete
MSDANFGFSKFSDNDFYSNVNKELIDSLDIQSNLKIVDLGCGSGGISKIIIEKLNEINSVNSSIIAVDFSDISLKEAKANLKSVSDSMITFVQSRYEEFSSKIKDKVDLVVLCNAIHYLDDKELVIKDVMKILKPGGRFAFNSSFFDGAHPEHTLGFYRKWMFKSMRILSKEYNTRPVKAEKIESRIQLNPNQYKKVLENCGMKIMNTKIREVNVPIDGWMDISGFKDFIEGIMPGVNLDIASESLQKAVKDTFKEMKLNFVQRNWMEIVATKA